jgi:hypothetical protein
MAAWGGSKGTGRSLPKTGARLRLFSLPWKKGAANSSIRSGCTSGGQAMGK